MELQQADSSSRRGHFDLSSSGKKWYLNKKFLLPALTIAMGLLFAICLFLGGYYTGLQALPSKSGSESGITAEPFIKELNVKWEGACPRRASSCPKSFKGIPPLILVSLDGFRPDYLKRGVTPTLTNISQCGTSAPYMYPSFPSKTFPNHYTIVTGLYPSSHGIIDNNMYDTKTGKLFKVGNPESRKSSWWQGEPLWVTAQQQGKKSGCFFWPGSEVKIKDQLPTYYKKYSSSVKFENRVDTILEWLDLPKEKRPDFLTLYFNQPDHAAHYFGTASKQVNEALTKVDNMIARLFAGLQQRNLLNCVNVIILSDHGMADVSCQRMIKLQDHINVAQVYTTLGAFGRLRPKGAKNITVIENLVSNLQCKSDHMRVYLKEQLPVRCHYADNSRIEPIFLDLDAGWTVTNQNTSDNDNFCSGGNHGYDNFFPEMRALFMAHGPSFKFNHTVQPFLNIELYEMMSDVMNITPSSNNGTTGSLHHLLSNPRSLPPQKQPDPIIIATVPLDKKAYNLRIYASNCTCPENKPQRNIKNVNESTLEHLPFGIPHSFEENGTLRLLYNKDYIGAFDVKYQLPMWTSYSLSRQVNVTDTTLCWKGDARIDIDSTSRCSYYNESVVTNNDILQRPAFPVDFATLDFEEQAMLVTNSVPKHENHVSILEKYFNQMIAAWVKLRGSLNIISGPAFDVHATGVRPDIPNIMKIHAKYGPLVVPSHYFYIITWCQDRNSLIQDCDSTELNVAAFLLPNTPFTYNCEAADKMIKKHVARVIDVETLTGISFFTELPLYDKIRLETKVPEF